MLVGYFVKLMALRNLLADLGADLLEIRLPLTQCSRRAGLGVRRGAGGFR